MTQHEMLMLVQAQLAIDLNCSVSDLNGKKDNLVFIEYEENQGRRPFPRSIQHFDMLSMGKSIIISATSDILRIVKPLLADADRDSAFSMPFVYGHSLYYLPDLDLFSPLSAPENFDYELIEQKYIPELYKLEGFQNAIQYDIAHPHPDILVASAKNRYGRGKCELRENVANRNGYTARIS